jgi:hypothetical protein
MANFFMKAETRAQHGLFLSKLSVIDPSWVWGGRGACIVQFSYFLIV